MSRKILWLEVSTTNKDSAVIAGYYVKAVQKYGILFTLTNHYFLLIIDMYLYKIYIGCPRIVRGDRGTENSRLAFLQPFLRRNHVDRLAGINSFQYGKSVHNQVIFVKQA